jgi:carbon monoxide dehydrogenase subunit G
MILLTVSRVLNAPIDEVWAMTSSFGAVGAWIPGVTRVTLTGYGVGAVRFVSTAVGIVEETLTLIDPDRHRIRYNAKAPGMEMLNDCLGGTDLVALNATQTRIDWVIEADHAVDLTGIAGFLTEFFEAGIAGLAKFLGAIVD